MGFWESFESGAEKAMNYMEKKNEEMLRQLERKKKEFQRRVARMSDDEIMRTSRNPNLTDFQRVVFEEEIRKRNL